MKVILFFGPGGGNWNYKNVEKVIKGFETAGADELVCCGDGVNPLSNQELEEGLNWINLWFDFEYNDH